MLPDQVSNPGPLTYESDALPIALRGPAIWVRAKTVGTRKRTFLAWLFSKKMSRYCHSPVVGGGVCVVVQNFDIF